MDTGASASLTSCNFYTKKGQGVDIEHANGTKSIIREALSVVGQRSVDIQNMWTVLYPTLNYGIRGTTTVVKGLANGNPTGISFVILKCSTKWWSAKREVIKPLHSTTVKSPSVMIWGWRIATKLNLIRPCVAATVLRKKARVFYPINIAIGETVWVRVYRGWHPAWIEAVFFIHTCSVAVFLT